jgi:thymidylate synthase, flavin-dependent|nr:MAG TPA: Thymidylate synthase complementing protein [Crassvirales sp.]
MRLIKPSFEIWDQQEGLGGIYKQIERAGRVCYKSEDKITETSAKEFVERMIKSGHGAMLEHGTVYLKAKTTIYGGMGSEIIECPLYKYSENPYSVVEKDNECFPDYLYVTTNFRVLVENDWLEDLKYVCKPTEYHAKRITVKFICDRGVSHEFVRHRVFSFAQESTRYCNYSKSKFGNELTIILPEWWENSVDIKKNLYKEAWQSSEDTYRTLMASKITPQEARAVLPNSLKTELVMTGFVSDWEHFFKLRDAGSAHPQARELAHPLHMEFLRRNYLVDLYDEANPD